MGVDVVADIGEGRRPADAGLASAGHRAGDQYRVGGVTRHHADVPEITGLDVQKPRIDGASGGQHTGRPGHTKALGARSDGDTGGSDHRPALTRRAECQTARIKGSDAIDPRPGDATVEGQGGGPGHRHLGATAAQRQRRATGQHAKMTAVLGGHRRLAGDLQRLDPLDQGFGTIVGDIHHHRTRDTEAEATLLVTAGRGGRRAAAAAGRRLGGTAELATQLLEHAVIVALVVGPLVGVVLGGAAPSRTTTSARAAGVTGRIQPAGTAAARLGSGQGEVGYHPAVIGLDQQITSYGDVAAGAGWRGHTTDHRSGVALHHRDHRRHTDASAFAGGDAAADTKGVGVVVGADPERRPTGPVHRDGTNVQRYPVLNLRQGGVVDDIGH